MANGRITKYTNHSPRYHNYIPGDSPELMPLDETLHVDIHACARYHVAITSHLPQVDHKKFSFCTPKEISRAYRRIVDPVTGGAASSNQIVQDCEKWLHSLEKIRAAGGKMVEGFGRNGHRRGHQGRRGGYRIKKQQKSANWIHRDAIGLTQHMWCESVTKVDAKLESLSTPNTLAPSTLTPGTVQTQAADNMAADANMTPMDSENTDETTGKTTGNITSYTSGVSNQSPLTMLEFSDIESENDEREMVSNKRKFVIVRSDDDEIDVEEEENDYADLDEEVLNLLLGLKNNMPLD
jgi:hypothetical protein